MYVEQETNKQKFTSNKDNKGFICYILQPQIKRDKKIKTTRRLTTPSPLPRSNVERTKLWGFQALIRGKGWLGVFRQMSRRFLSAVVASQIIKSCKKSCLLKPFCIVIYPTCSFSASSWMCSGVAFWPNC